MADEEGSKIIIQVKVVPRSSRNQIVGREKGVFRVKLTSPPIDGKANKALRELLARRLGLSKDKVEVISGERSRMKSISIKGLSLEDINRLLY